MKREGSLFLEGTASRESRNEFPTPLSSSVDSVRARVVKLQEILNLGLGLQPIVILRKYSKIFVR